MSGWKVMSSIWNRGGLQHCGLERKNSTLPRMHPTKVQKQTSGEIPFCALTRWCRKGQINLVEHTEHTLRKIRRSLLLGFIYRSSQPCRHLQGFCQLLWHTHVTNDSSFSSQFLWRTSIQRVRPADTRHPRRCCPCFHDHSRGEVFWRWAKSGR